MKNKPINFRLNPYQLARGLWLIRTTEPGYQPSSAAEIVKRLYLEYTAKTTTGHRDEIFIPAIEEVYLLINQKRSKKSNLDEFLNQRPAIPDMPAELEETESIIKTVTDFSPPTDWLDKNE